MARISQLLAKGRTYSFEFFPPKTDAGWLSLGKTISALERLNPSFVSVTYGAGGSTRARTHDLVAWVRKETEISPMAHLTCQAHTRQEINAILDGYLQAGVENIMALGGDAPQDGAAVVSDYRFASELVDDVAGYEAFDIGVAAHPEVHPRSPDRASDRQRLAEKLRHADFAVTQFFFDVDHYRRLVDELADLGVTKPILPGIMPVTNLRQVSRMAELSGTAVPAELIERISLAGDDPDEAYRIGVAAAAELCQALLDAGAPGLHFYTLNRSGATIEIVEQLGAAPTPAG